MASADFSSDETFEYKCTAMCIKKNLMKEAVYACQDCKKHFCVSCLEFHNSLHDDHTLVLPSVFFPLEPKKLPTELCKKHVGKRIDVWCAEHDEVGCVSCGLFDHRSCKNLKDIPSEIKDLFKQEEFDLTKEELSRSLESLTEKQYALNEEKENLMVEKNTQLSKIEQYTQKMISMLKALEKNSIDEINEKFGEIEDKLMKIADDFKIYEEDLRQCTEKMESCSGNEPQMFVTMKNVKQRIALANQNCQELDFEDCTVVFRPYSYIEQQIDRFHSVGSSSKFLRKNVFDFKLKQKINVEIKEDSEDCYIGGSCLLPDGTVVVTDNDNKKLKHVDLSSASVIDFCILSGNPSGVCLVNEKELAVAILDYKIQFVSLGQKMALSRLIYVEHECGGMYCRNNELYVSDCDEYIYVYDLQGSLLRILELCCRYLAVSKDGEKIFNACRDFGLVCLEKSGGLEYRQDNENIVECFGVCLGDKSDLFVCGNQSNNVVQFTDSGEELGEVVNMSDAVNKPLSLCFDPNQQRLVITQDSNTILVFEKKAVY